MKERKRGGGEEGVKEEGVRSKRKSEGLVGRKSENVVEWNCTVVWWMEKWQRLEGLFIILLWS